MKRISRILFVVSSILLLVVVVTGVFIFNKWKQPLGPALLLPTYTEREGTQVTVARTQSVISTTGGNLPTQPFTSQASELSLSTPVPTRQPLCGGPTTMTILLIGSDERSTGYLYGLADSIHVARIDFTLPDVLVVDFPRDLWVEIPGIASHYGITHGKLNQAYLFGNPGMGYYDGPGAGPGLLARTLDQNFGMRVDHYFAVDRQTFVQMIDTIGGVDVTLDTSVDLNYHKNTPDPKLILPSGQNHLDGKLALLLATNRVPTTFQRMKYQKLLISALREKLLRPEMLPKLPLLAAQFINSVQTDLSMSDIKSLICISQAIPRENVLIDSFPESMFKANATYDQYRHVTTFTYSVDNAQLRKLVTEFMNGIWPVP